MTASSIHPSHNGPYKTSIEKPHKMSSSSQPTKSELFWVFAAMEEDDGKVAQSWNIHFGDNFPTTRSRIREFLNEAQA